MFKATKVDEDFDRTENAKTFCNLDLKFVLQQI